MVEVRGGNNLNKALAEIGKKYASKSRVRVGFLEGATYPDGTPVATVAAVQNYGSAAQGIPARPFMDNTIKQKQSEWAPALLTMIEGGKTPDEALDALGDGIEGQIKQSIIDIVEPPLKPATIKRKGFDKPLIDKGHMLASTGHEVKDGSAE